MAEQYIVAVFLDATMNVDAAGPFRSRKRAQQVCDQINDAGEWTTERPDLTTTVAQVVHLRTVADLIEQAGGERG